MVSEDIFGGLKSAIIRGYSLKDAMISFYNAGYKKEEIEEAARKLQYHLAENKELRDLVQSGGKKVLTEKNYQPETQVKSIETKSTETKPAETKTTEAKPVEKKPLETTQMFQEPTKEVSAPQKLPELEASEEEKRGMPARTFKALRPQKPEQEKQVKEKTHIPISNYMPGTSIRVMTIVLIVLLVFLLGALASVFIFRNQIIQFFNSILTS